MKRILSLDGGGVRGIVTIAFLEQISAVLTKARKREVDLTEVFQLIGGTSTGAIIAAGLSLGLKPLDLAEYYMELGPKVFRKSRFRLIGWQPVFDARILKSMLESVFGERRLDSPDIRTGLAIVTKRLDTGSAWLIHNNPAGRYWHSAEDGSYIGNRHYRLLNVVRASTAAPHYFDPQSIKITEDMEPGLFVDGAVSPYNMPALALLQLVSIPEYGFNWQTSASDLGIVSIGTGSFRHRLDPATARRMTSASLAIKSLSGLIADSEAHALTLLQMLGETRTPWKINSEIGTLEQYVLPRDPLFEFVRYNVILDQAWLKAELDIAVGEKDLATLRDFTNSRNMRLAYEIAQEAARAQVREEHFAGLW